MKRQGKHVDSLRIAALFILMGGIIYFYLNLLFPYAIPFVLKLGVIDRPLNILVIGTDITFNVETKQANMEKGRSDAMMLVRFDALKDRINIVSIPRDAYVEIPGYGFQKINAAYVLGDIELTQRTVEKLTGIKVDRYVIVNTKGIVKLVDLLGGVRVDVEKDLYYVDRAQGLFIDLKQGKQKLSGRQAEGYIRFRHDAVGDTGRIRRQQDFFRALAGKLAAPTSIIKAPFIAEIIRNNIKSNFSLKEFIMAANSVRMMPARHIKSETLSGSDANNEAGSVIILDRAGLERAIKQNF